jgi:hypothetical protein
MLQIDPSNRFRLAAAAALLILVLSAPLAMAQSPLQTYRQLYSVGLDSAQVYHVREFVLDRQDLHVYLNDGTIAFMRGVNGKVTGAYFEGDGQILLRPPDAVERNSLGLFSGLGVLDERFESAFLRFNDDLYDQIRASSRKADDSDLATDHNDVASNLAHGDALRLLETMTTAPGAMGSGRDQFLHMRISSERLGNFDVIYDSLAPEQFLVGRLAPHSSDAWYDIWMSFPSEDRREMEAAEHARLVIDPWASSSTVKPVNVRIDAKLLPPENIEASAELDLDVVSGGQSVLVFELSRYLNVSNVALADGTHLEFIHNEAMSGTDLSKRGNDLLTVILPAALKTGDKLTLKFNYAGAVMKQAGNGLLFVGERGIWYPNRGLSMAQFDLKFHWPREWTLIATGKEVSEEQNENGFTGRWISETEIPIAGFNLGQYAHGSAKAGDITINAFATTSLETIVPSLAEVQQDPKDKKRHTLTPKQEARLRQLSPAEGSQAVAEYAARSVSQYSEWFGPYPFSTLSVTQFPGNLSQGWPTLVYLSSAAFLSAEQRKEELNMNAIQQVIYGQIMLPHEAAHQWWGDLVGWRSYRDQWLVEALADYSAMMLLEQQHPENVRLVLETYRRDLLYKNEAGHRYTEAGPVSLGFRLSSSVFPNGYIVISYGRGAWLMHMLRCLFRDYAVEAGMPPAKGDQAFREALHSLRKHYAHTNITIRELQKEMESHISHVSSDDSSVRHTLGWFFEGWVNGTAIPKITLKDVRFKSTGKQTVATFTVVQDECPDTLMTEVPIYAVDANNRYKLLRRVMADGPETKARLTIPAGTRRLSVDPEWTLLTSNPEGH